MHRVLITGANGFVGSNLVSYFLKMGSEVTGLVRPSAKTDLLPADFEPVRVNYWDTAGMRQILKEHDVIIHNAAITRGKNWKEFQVHNVDLTTHLVSIANEVESIKQFTFISSQAASGICDGLTGKKEHEECFPVSNYGKSKLLAEEQIVNKSSKPWTIIRPSSVFGIGDSDFLHYFKLVNSGFSVLLGYRPKYISLIPVSCLTDLIYRTIGNPKAFNEIFFASCKSYYSWEEFITLLEEVMGKKSFRIRIPEFLIFPLALLGELKGKFSRRPGIINLQKLKEMKGGFWICDAGKAKESLGFEFEKDLLEDLRKTYLWYKEQGWL